MTKSPENSTNNLNPGVKKINLEISENKEKINLTTVYFRKSDKSNDVICRTNSGKISFVDRNYKGIIPKPDEKWAIKVVKELDKVNIIQPIFKIDNDTPLEKLLECNEFNLKLDFFNGELVLYDEGKQFKRFPYDGRWDKKMFFSKYSFPEAIKLHKLAKKIVESGKSAIMVDSLGKLVYISPSNIDKTYEYDYYGHIFEVKGDEENFEFVDDDAKKKWTEMQENIRQDFLKNENNLSADYHDNFKIGRALGLEKNKITINVSQNLIGSSRWSNSYHEVISTAKTSWSGKPIEGETVCQNCGFNGKTLDSEFTIYYEKSGGGYFDRDIGSATHKGLGKCLKCGITQDENWGEIGKEITDLPNFPERDGSAANWKQGEKEEYEFPFEDDFIKGKLVVTVLPKIGATYLQKYKIWKVESRIFYVEKIKMKCMKPDSIRLQSLTSNDKNLGQQGAELIFDEKTEFPLDFTMAEKYVAGWLPVEYGQEKSGVYTTEELRDEIAGYLGDTGEYFDNDIPRDLKDTIAILKSMIENGYINSLPPINEIEKLYPLFKEDYIEFGGKETEFPTKEEWIKTTKIRN